MVAPHPAGPPARTQREITAAFMHGPHDRIDVGHSRLAYWRFGSGPDVVLVHGWPLHAATFRGVIARLAGDFTLHAFDLPGAGMTDWDADAPTDVDSHAATVRRAVDALGLSRYAFIAHDSGATIARLVAADDPRVLGIAMGNTEIPGHDSHLLHLLVRIGRSPAGRLMIFGLMRWRLCRRIVFGACFTEAAYIEGEFADLFIRPLFTSKRVGEGQLGLIRSFDFGAVRALAGVHARIRAPVLCVWGSRDPLFPLAKAHAMLSHFPGGAELVEVRGAKVFVHEDRAEEFAAAVRPFLRRCSGPEPKA